VSLDSLTQSVKDELVAVSGGTNNQRLAELSALLRFAGGLHVISGQVAVEVELDHIDVAKRLRRELHDLLGFSSDATIMQPTTQRPYPLYLVRVVKGGDILARQTGLLDQRKRPVRGLSNRLTTSPVEDLAPIWRGAFLARGVLSEPGRSSSIELVSPTAEAAMAMVGIAQRIGVSAKAREVRMAHRVFVREPESIAALLVQMGAPHAKESWEELRERREVRANANRLVNFDDANLRRSAQAAVAACARVERALEILGEDVPDHLQYAGALRLTHREASLDELGHYADPPLTKDAVAGRIRRLLAMADKKAEDLGIPSTMASVPPDLSGY
jgi:cell division protein WhiA